MEESSDAIIQAITEAHYYRHLDGKGLAISNAFQMCEMNTNRFSELLKGIALTNATAREDAIIWMGKYGNTNCLETLFEFAGNSDCGLLALRSAARIGGVTSNFIDSINRYCSITNGVSAYDRTCARQYLVDAAFRDGATETETIIAAPVIAAYANSEIDNTQAFDKHLMSRDPSYRWSKRRLLALRSVMSAVANPSQTNYLSIAISELVSYPELGLPD